MDKTIEEAVRKIIKDEIGELVSKELELRFKPIQKVVDAIREENRKSYDQISTQITEDRKDINQLRIDTAKGVSQNKVIIDNQNSAEEKVVAAVKEEVQQIPKNTEKAVENIFAKKPFLKKLVEKFTIK